MNDRLLTKREMKKHWAWVDEGDGYNQIQDWNIKTLLEAQDAKASKWWIEKIEKYADWDLMVNENEDRLPVIMIMPNDWQAIKKLALEGDRRGNKSM